MQLHPKIRFIYLACFAIFLISCSTANKLKVDYDYDRKASFSGYKTFAIDTLRASKSVSLLNRQRLVDAVEAEMAKKGFTASTTPDLLVHISAIFKNEQSVTANTDYYGSYYGYGGYYRPYGWSAGGTYSHTTYDVRDYKVGSVIIGIADANTKNLLWEGIGNKEIDQKSDDPEKAIATAVGKIMESFPPPPEKKK